MKKQSRLCLSLASLTLLVSGCLTNAGRPGVAPNGGGSVLASIDGIDDEDRENADTKYWLKCDNGVQILHSKIVESDDGKEYLQFDGKQIKGASCGMEVWNEELADDSAYKWFGKFKDGRVARGLLYGSNYAKVDKGTLKLELWKSYTKTDVPSFSVALRVLFDGDSELAEDRLLATMTCGDSTFASDKVALEERAGNVEINFLPIAELNGKSCTELKVVEKSEQAENTAAKTFTGPLTDVVFTDENAAEQGKTLSFPKDGEDPFLLTEIEDEGGTVGVVIEPGECLKTIVGSEECGDKRRFELPYQTNYFVAYVRGRTENGKGDMREYVVAAGTKGIQAFAGEIFDVDMINLFMAGTDGAPSFNFYRGNSDLFEAARDGIPLTPEMIAGTGFEADEIELASLKGIKFLHVSSFYVYGFHEDSALESKNLPLTWLASVEAKKAGSDTLNFVVGGSNSGFVSTTHPAGDKLFAFDEFVADANEDGDLTKWLAFQTKDQLAADTSCTFATHSSLLSAASRIVIEGDNGSSLTACKADLSSLEGIDASEYEVAFTGYSEGWKVFAGSLD